VGSALVHAVLAAAEALDETTVLLLGAPGYYRRFGFRPAAELGVLAPDDGWGAHFQIRPLRRHRPEIRGRFAYPEPFDRVG
jgi:putative acetyltransferase